MGQHIATEILLGTYLKDRRAKLDPAAFGFPPKRRRTPGLRREEVALRANISPTWYTWLEQGRGGNPSADVLDRIARALTLTDVEREHMFLIGLGRPPEIRPGYCLTHCTCLVTRAAGECPEWQRGRTVNPLAYAFVGSSPTSPTTLKIKGKFSSARP